METGAPRAAITACRVGSNTPTLTSPVPGVILSPSASFHRTVKDQAGHLVHPTRASLRSRTGWRSTPGEGSTNKGYNHNEGISRGTRSLNKPVCQSNAQAFEIARVVGDKR